MYSAAPTDGTMKRERERERDEEIVSIIFHTKIIEVYKQHTKKKEMYLRERKRERERVEEEKLRKR